MVDNNIKAINHKFDLEMRMEMYKQTREDTRKCFDQVFQFSNNAIRGLFILTAGSAIALMNMKLDDGSRKIANEYIVWFGLCAFLCALCSAISYISQSLFTMECGSRADDIMSKLHEKEWPRSKRTKWLGISANTINVLAIGIYIAACVLFCSKLYCLYQLIAAGKF